MVRFLFVAVVTFQMGFFFEFKKLFLLSVVVQVNSGILAHEWDIRGFDKFIHNLNDFWIRNHSQKLNLYNILNRYIRVCVCV